MASDIIADAEAQPAWGFDIFDGDGNRSRFQFRLNTSDCGIFNTVALENEYQLPETLAPDDVVMDVGAHIGSFTYAALQRGSRRVYAFEAGEENCRLAAENLRLFIERGEVELTHGAVWRSDPNDDELRFTPGEPFHGIPGLEGQVNTGGGTVMWPADGEPVPKLAFDALVRRITGENGRIRLLKLDCEGAEWPILLTSRTLHLVDEICGEFHEIGGEFLEVDGEFLEAGQAHDPATAAFCGSHAGRYLVDDLVTLLRDAGFEVTCQRNRRPDGKMDGMGLFFARRPGPGPNPADSLADSGVGSV